MKTTSLCGFLLSALLISCNKVPITKRKQLNLLPESTVMSMSVSSYQSFLSQHPAAPSSDPNAQMVQRVGLKISQGVEKFMQQQGMSDLLKGYKWEFNLVNDNTVNAWCMPGGKVVVYTGILPVTQDEAGLAVVMGHEIAHAIARHGNERMSQMMLAQGIGIGLDFALQEKPAQTRNIFLTAYGAGSTLGVLAYSRKHESEADRLGLIFMSMAGYDPTPAIGFWQRMSKKGGGGGVPEFMSTHPGDERRIRDIKRHLPEAMKYYHKG
jgi:predicted Zn-dependent protease